MSSRNLTNTLNSTIHSSVSKGLIIYKIHSYTLAWDIINELPPIQLYIHSNFDKHFARIFALKPQSVCIVFWYAQVTKHQNSSVRFIHTYIAAADHGLLRFFCVRRASIGSIYDTYFPDLISNFQVNASWGKNEKTAHHIITR